TESGGDAPFFFNADRRLERIFEHAGQTARFCFRKPARDLGAAAVNRFANHRRGLDHAVEHDSEPETLRFLSDVAENFRAFTIESKLHAPAFISEICVRTADVLASEVGLFLDEQPFRLRFLCALILLWRV